MIPEQALPFALRDGEVVPRYFDASDHPWLARLLEEARRFVMEPRRALSEFMRAPLPFAAPARKARLALIAMERRFAAHVVAAVPPQKARAELFRARARSSQSREEVCALAATALGVPVPDLEASLFADLPEAQILGLRAPLPSPADFALQLNLLLLQSLLHRSSAVRVTFVGAARPLVRQAKLRGLICVIGSKGELEVSGPLSIFRHTLVYGRALAELVTFLPWCEQFRLEAALRLKSGAARLGLASGVLPIPPAVLSRRYDSKLEERFARDIAKEAPRWHVVREPEPIATTRGFIFPDFALVHRDDPTRRWLVEIVGFWTPEYLERKLHDLREAGLPNLILCVDEARGCGTAEMPAAARVVPFKRRVDAAAVARLLE